ARMLIIDEAARTQDSLYRSVRPMLAVSKGRLVCISSAWAKTGFFFEAWENEPGWKKVQVRATECPRIDQEFLDEERRVLGEKFFAVEYMAEFRDAVDQVFDYESVQAAFAAPTGRPPLF